MRILLVDDDLDARSAIRINLRRRFRAEVDEAPDGGTALQRILKADYDLAIIDFNMPFLNGLETLRAIRRSPRHRFLPVLMLTGSSDEALVRAAVGLGVVGFLVKPVQTEVLLARVEQVLSQVQTSDPSQGGP